MFCDSAYNTSPVALAKVMRMILTTAKRRLRLGFIISTSSSVKLNSLLCSLARAHVTKRDSVGRVSARGVGCLPGGASSAWMREPSLHGCIHGVPTWEAPTPRKSVTADATPNLRADAQPQPA